MRKKVSKPTIIRTKPALNKAVFMGRDGTLNCNEGYAYIYHKEDVKFNTGVIEGLKKLHDAGYLLFIVTNQGGIAKGIYTHEDVQSVHDYMCEEFGKHGIRISKIYYCPHHESIKACICRKPSPYMIKQALDEFHIDRNQSYLIGSETRDTKAAEEAGIKVILSHKNQDFMPAVNRILNIKPQAVDMNLDESEF